MSAWNSKTLRSSAGSLFRVPFVDSVAPETACAWFQSRGLAVHLAVPRGGAAAQSANLRGPFALVIGSEGHGIGEVLRAAGTGLSLATAGVESLNAAMAAAILLYEASRQRASL